MNIFDENPLIGTMNRLKEAIPAFDHIAKLAEVTNRFTSRTEHTSTNSVQNKLTLGRPKKRAYQSFEEMFENQDFSIVKQCIIGCRIADKSGTYIDRPNLPKYRLYAFCEAINNEFLSNERSLLEISKLLQEWLKIRYTQLKRTKEHDAFVQDYTLKINVCKSAY